VKKIEQNTTKNLNININKDDNTINDFLYCWNHFSTRPNRLTIYNSYSSSDFNEYILSNHIEKTIHTEVIPAEEMSIINDQMFVKIEENIFISYIIVDRNNDNSIVNEVTFFYKTDDDYKKIISIIEKLDNFIVSYQEESSCSINTLSISQNSIEIEPLLPKELDYENIDLYYNKKTFSKIDKLIKSIKKSKKGLSVLYGERGVGKTSIINYLSSKLDRIVIFIPNNLIEQTINNPEFRKFLKKHHNPILIIDDCEMLFNEVFAKSNIFVNNLLQLVEGFLSDSIEVSVVSIFNVDDEDEIDHSLLDCNTLIDVIRFDLLSEEESVELSKHLEFDKKYKSKNRLVDVLKKKETKNQSDIGF
jgi:hypothetical protein